MVDSAALRFCCLLLSSLLFFIVDNVEDDAVVVIFRLCYLWCLRQRFELIYVGGDDGDVNDDDDNDELF